MKSNLLITVGVRVFTCIKIMQSKTKDKVTDCQGCFDTSVKLTSWETFTTVTYAITQGALYAGMLH